MTLKEKYRWYCQSCAVNSVVSASGFAVMGKFIFILIYGDENLSSHPAGFWCIAVPSVVIGVIYLLASLFMYWSSWFPTRHAMKLFREFVDIDWKELERE